MHFSYDEQLAENMNFVETLNQIEKLLGAWPQRSLTLSGRIVSFKTLALSKIVYVASMLVVPDRILNKLESIHKNLFGRAKSRKLDTTPLLQIIQTEVIKDVDISAKIKALQLVYTTFIRRKLSSMETNSTK